VTDLRGSQGERETLGIRISEFASGAEKGSELLTVEGRGRRSEIVKARKLFGSRAGRQERPPLREVVGIRNFVALRKPSRAPRVTDVRWKSG
jgi:hypothetical protein